MVDINIQTVLEMLAQLVGIEGAEKILNDAVREAKLPRQAFYSETEFREIGEKLKTRGGTVKFFAELVVTSEYREQQYQKIIDRERKQKEDLAALYGRMEGLNIDLRIANDELEKANESMKEMQEQLVRNEKMATIGQLASSIAHELRNPLTSIKNIKYYLNKYLKSSDPKINEFLNLLSTDIERINSILSDLLDYTQAKNYNKSLVSLNAFLASCLDSPGHKLERIEVREDLSPEITRQLYADAGKLKQVFSNLIRNACDAMSNGGTLTLVTALHTDGETGREYARVEIADTGCGMTGEAVEHAFEPLFTTKTGNIGLGLAIVKDIVEGHGGSIRIESAPGKGTKVTLLLPLDAPDR